MNWEERVEKRRIRNLFLDHIDRRSDQQIRYLSLPGRNAVMEKLLVLNGIRPFIFDGVEWNEEEYKFLQEEDIPSLSKIYYPAGIEKFISTYHPTKQYNVVWLDYCGTITSSHLDTIQYLVSHTSTSLLLGLTFMRGRENGKILDLLSRYRSPNDPTLNQARLDLIDHAVLRSLPDKARVTTLAQELYQDGTSMFFSLYEVTHVSS